MAPGKTFLLPLVVPLLIVAVVADEESKLARRFLFAVLLLLAREIIFMVFVLVRDKMGRLKPGRIAWVFAPTSDEGAEILSSSSELSVGVLARLL